KDHLNSPKVANLLPSLVRQPLPANEKLARLLVEKAEGDEAKGKGTYYLAQMLMNKVEMVRTVRDADQKTVAQLEAAYGKDAVKQMKQADAGKVEKEAEDLFMLAAEKYGDVKVGRDQALKDAVKPILFEMKHLSIGKVAPEIEGEDIDGKKFKLSDYRG